MSENRRKENTQEKSAPDIREQYSAAPQAYEHISESMIRIIRSLSSFIDRTLFNPRYTRIVALVLAVILYISVNLTNGTKISTMNYSRDMAGVAVSAKYNSDTFELSGLPETATVRISGDAAAVTAAYNSRGIVLADLEGLTEGQHEVRLTTEGFGDSVDIMVDSSVANITLKKKTTRQFDLSYDFINLDRINSIYSVGTPVFDYSRVNVRASKDTLDSIAFVKALIDVGDQSATFEQDAHLIAYNSSGQPVNADIVPSTIHVTVPVTSPNKTVAIEVEVSGEVPNGMAIDSITMDQHTVTIYGPESVIGQIDKVIVSLNASTITKDSTLLRPITLPSGVNSSNINQITINVTLAEGESRVIDGVKINYRNNTNNYKASQPDNKMTTSVMVFGSAANIADITADDIYVYVDMSEAKPGLMEFPLLIEQPSSGLVKYTLMDATYTLNVLGESNSDEDADSGTGVNNG